MVNTRRHAYMLYPSHVTPQGSVTHQIQYQSSASAYVASASQSIHSDVQALENALNDLHTRMRELGFDTRTPNTINADRANDIASTDLLKTIQDDVSSMSHGDFVWIHYIGRVISKSEELSGASLRCLEMYLGKVVGGYPEDYTYGFPSHELLKIAKVASPGVKVLFTVDAAYDADGELPYGIGELPYGDVQRANPDTLILSDVWCISSGGTSYLNISFTNALKASIANEHHLKSVTEWVQEIKSAMATVDVSLTYGQADAANRSVFASRTNGTSSLVQSPTHQCAISSKPRRKIRFVLRLEDIGPLHALVQDWTSYRLHSVDAIVRIEHTEARRLYLNPTGHVEFSSCSDNGPKLYKRTYRIEEDTRCGYVIRIALESQTDADSLAKTVPHLYQFDDTIEFSLWASVYDSKLPYSCAHITLAVESMKAINEALVSATTDIKDVTSCVAGYKACEVYTEATDEDQYESIDRSPFPTATLKWRSYPSYTSKTLSYVVVVGLRAEDFKGYTISDPTLQLSTVGGHTIVSKAPPRYAHAHRFGVVPFEARITNQTNVLPIAYFELKEQLTGTEDERWAGVNVRLTSMRAVPDVQTMPAVDAKCATLYLATEGATDGTINVNDGGTFNDISVERLYTPPTRAWNLGHSEMTSYSPYQISTENYLLYAIDQRPPMNVGSPTYSISVSIDENTPIYFTLSHSNVSVTSLKRNSVASANLVDWISPFCFRLNQTPMMSSTAIVESVFANLFDTLTLSHETATVQYVHNTYVPHTTCLSSVHSQNLISSSTNKLNHTFILIPSANAAHNLGNFLVSNTFAHLHTESHQVNTSSVYTHSTLNNNGVSGVSHDGVLLQNLALVHCLPSFDTLNYIDIDSFEFSIVMVWRYHEAVGVATISTPLTRLFGSDDLLRIEWIHGSTNTVSISIGSGASAQTTSSVLAITASPNRYYILGCSVRFVDPVFCCELHLKEYNLAGTLQGSAHILKDDTITESALGTPWSNATETGPGTDYRQILAINMPNNDLDLTTSTPSAIILGMCTMYDKAIDIEDRMAKAEADWAPV